MKKISLISLSILLLTSFASQASKAERFNKLDVDQDQHLSMSEFKVNLDNHFVRLNITDSKQQNQMLKNGFKRKDRNSDGKISLEEFTAPAKKSNKKTKPKNK
ncbi:EF-hand domain-containing protein [Thalassotalea fonticola]|uniref:EF-hand domain-containing protein n=1 Tax=Thalassotalea fonticola TaxID=3065649 RepID=A0ABZ0GTF3_9GAMM|nr:EF-hand domain-containing protein [Colwelliaceae bacterium S1-1]